MDETEDPAEQERVNVVQNHTAQLGANEPAKGELLTTAEVAAITGLTVNTLENYRSLRRRGLDRGPEFATKDRALLSPTPPSTPSSLRSGSADPMSETNETAPEVEDRLAGSSSPLISRRVGQTLVLFQNTPRVRHGNTGFRQSQEICEMFNTTGALSLTKIGGKYMGASPTFWPDDLGPAVSFPLTFRPSPNDR